MDGVAGGEAGTARVEGCYIPRTGSSRCPIPMNLTAEEVSWADGDGDPRCDGRGYISKNPNVWQACPDCYAGRFLASDPEAHQPG
jgi:hypothetical protein